MLNQKYAASLLDLICFLGFSIANSSENQKPMLCVEVAVYVSRGKSLMKPQVDKMCSGRMCNYLIGWVDFDGFQGGMMSFYTDSLDMQRYYPVRVGGDKIKTS